MTDDGQIATRRQWILGGIFGAIAIGTAIALGDVLWTIFFGLTVAYVLSPPRRWLRDRGIGPLTATVLVTTGAIGTLLLVAAPLVYFLMSEIDTAIEAIDTLPETFDFLVLGMTIEFELEQVLNTSQRWLRSTGVAVSTRIPEYLLKLGVFAFVVFGVVHRERDISHQLMDIVPPRYRDIFEALHQRARDTLVAIYVLQGVTAIGTIVIAIPIFLAFGYSSWLMLSIAAGFLQFVPVIGPSALILGLAIVDLAAGDLVGAVMMAAVGGVFIAAMPDLLLRPRLARWTTELSSTLYFIGFVGGMLSLGAIGVIVGPLLVALLVESATLVKASFDEEHASGKPANDTGADR